MNAESLIMFYRIISILTAVLFMNVCLYLGFDILQSSLLAVVFSMEATLIAYLLRTRDKWDE